MRPKKEWNMEEGTKKLFIETYGCQMNVADSEVIASIMRMAGYEPTENIDEADAIFLNTGLHGRAHQGGPDRQPSC